MPTRVTQAELRSVLEPYKTARSLAIAIRRRIETEGAEIEPGPLSVTTEGESNPLREFAGDPGGCLVAGLDVYENSERIPSTPRWVTHTPDPMGYGLFMTTPNAHTEGQDIELSREEFLALKAELAKIRGYAAAEVAHAR
jgi:hypothetical protein